jgi:hypothetical protein
MTEKTFKGWRYVGAGAFIAGFPAKNISVEEARRRALDTKVLDASPLYEKTAAKKAGDK